MTFYLFFLPLSGWVEESEGVTVSEKGLWIESFPETHRRVSSQSEVEGDLSLHMPKSREKYKRQKVSEEIQRGKNSSPLFLLNP
jgi:hypothetical protein